MLPSEQTHLHNSNNSRSNSAFINELDGARYYSTDIYGQLLINKNPYTTTTTATTPPHHHNTSATTPPSTPPQQRTIYLGNVPSDISVCDIMDQVKIGPIQAIRPLPEKNGLFITFIDSNAAAQFYHDATRSHFQVYGQELKVGWGKPTNLTTSVSAALQNGASRNVYLGLLDDSITEELLRQDLSRFGHIEHVKIIPDKKIAFVHFLCITNAVKCVSTLQTESQWKTKRINFGKDRCEQQQRQQLQIQQLHQQQPHQTQQQKVYVLPAHQQPTIRYFDPYTGLPIMYNNNNNNSNNITNSTNTSSTTTSFPHLHQTQPQQQHHHHHHQPHSSNTHHQFGGIANRTIYLGNIHPDTTSEDICNVIRGGILSQIRFMPDKHIAFVTFVDPILAENFFNITECLVIKNRRLKLGWGKPSSLPLTVLNAVQNGGSRNVYIGNIDDSITEEKLKHDFSEYGDIELVNTLKEKNCAFVNFTSIAGAVRAIEGIRSKEEYKKFRINYGKDRCGNPPRFTNSNGTYNNSNSHQHRQTEQQQEQQESYNEYDEEDDDNLLTNTTATTSNITTPNNSANLINGEENSNDNLITSSSSPVQLLDVD